MNLTFEELREINLTEKQIKKFANLITNSSFFPESLVHEANYLEVIIQRLKTSNLTPHLRQKHLEIIRNKRIYLKESMEKFNEYYNFVVENLSKWNNDPEKKQAIIFHLRKLEFDKIDKICEEN